jgi:ABC-type nitrate/sulfonate/bicarbonate transport system permease component
MTSTRLGRFSIQLGGTALIVAVVWYLTASSNSYLIISLPRMLERFRQVWLFADFTSDFLPSFEHILIGFFIAVILGGGFGLAIGLVPWVKASTSGVIAFLRALPPVALLPPAIVVLGVGDFMRIFLIVFVCVWPILLNVADGVAEINSTMIATAQVYRLRGWRRICLMIIPAVSPRLFAGLRTSLAFAVLLSVVSEMVAATNGIGFFLIQAQEDLAVPDVWAAVIMLAILGFSLQYILAQVERRVLRWHLLPARDER